MAQPLFSDIDKAEEKKTEARPTIQQQIAQISSKLDKFDKAHAAKESLKLLQVAEQNQVDNINNAFKVCDTVLGNIDNLQSDDPIDVVIGIANITGVVAPMIGGPYGAVIGGACGLLTGILTMTQPKKPSMAEVVMAHMNQIKTEIFNKLDEMQDIKNEEMHAKNRMNFESKFTWLLEYLRKPTDNDQIDLGMMDNLEYGHDEFAVVTGKKQRFMKDESRNDYEKAQTMVHYIELYCTIANFRRTLLMMQWMVLKRQGRNECDNTLALLKGDLRQGKDILEFLSKLTKENRVLYTQTFLSNAKLSVKRQQFIKQYMRDCDCEVPELDRSMLFNGAGPVPYIISNVYNRSMRLGAYAHGSDKLVYSNKFVLDGKWIFTFIDVILNDDNSIKCGVYYIKCNIFEEQGLGYKNYPRLCLISKAEQGLTKKWVVMPSRKSGLYSITVYLGGYRSATGGALSVKDGDVCVIPIPSFMPEWELDTKSVEEKVASLLPFGISSIFKAVKGMQ